MKHFWMSLEKRIKMLIESVFQKREMHLLQKRYQKIKGIKKRYFARGTEYISYFSKVCDLTQDEKTLRTDIKKQNA